MALEDIAKAGTGGSAPQPGTAGSVPASDQNTDPGENDLQPDGTIKPLAEPVESAPTPSPAQTPDKGSEPAAAPTEPQLGEKGQNELSRLRADRRRLELERERLLGELEARRPSAPSAPTQSQAPTIEAFTDANGVTNWDSYQKADDSFRQAEIDRRVNQAVDTQYRVRRFDERKAEAARKDPELPSKVDSFTNSLARVPNAPAIAAAILANEVGPEIAGHLYDNPEDISRISRMAPLEAAMEIGRIGERIKLSTPQPQTKPRMTQASPPINPGGSGGSTAGAFDIEAIEAGGMAAHAAAMKNKRYGNR